jgi:hypothetical protein
MEAKQAATTNGFEGVPRFEAVIQGLYRVALKHMKGDDLAFLRAAGDEADCVLDSVASATEALYTLSANAGELPENEGLSEIFFMLNRVMETARAVIRIADDASMVAGKVSA